jgi:DNA-directed RNA polymerase omega subunit
MLVFMADMDDTIQESAHVALTGDEIDSGAADTAPVVPSEPLPPITSRFLYVDVAALRAKQLRRGAKVRYVVEEGMPSAHKPERVAMEEVRRGLVYYDVPAAKRAQEREDEA